MLLVLVIRCSVLYALVLLFARPHDVSTLLAMGALVSVTVATALRREALRGAMASDGTYVAIDVSGPSRLQVVTLACLESCFHLVGLVSVLLWLLVVWLPLMGVLFVECLLILYRIRIVVADDGVEVAPLTNRKVLGWSGLHAEHDGTYFKLRSGAATARFRLSSSLAKRFTDDLTGRGLTVHVVKPPRGIPRGKR